MRQVIHAAAVMGFAVMMLSAQQLPPAAGAAPTAAQAGPPKEEIEALQKIQGMTDPDARMKAVDDFSIKFPTSNFRGYAFTMGGEAAQAKQDSAKARFYYQNAIKADPNSDYAMVMLAADIAQRTGPNDTDKAQKLGEAQGYVDKATALINARTKQPGETDAQFEDGKKDDMGRVHMTIGLIDMANQKNAEAAKEFMLAADTGPQGQGDPMNLIRAGMAFNNAKQYDDANKALDRFIAIPGVPEPYKKIAEDEKKRGQQLRTQK